LKSRSAYSWSFSRSAVILSLLKRDLEERARRRPFDPDTY